MGGWQTAVGIVERFPAQIEYREDGWKDANMWKRKGRWCVDGW